MTLWGNRLALPILAAGLTVPIVGHASYDETEAFEISQAAIGRTIGGYEFTTSNGEEFRFDELSGRPVVVSMIYTSCYHICPMLTQRLADVVDVGWEALGEDSFDVVTIGFDTRVDSPDVMKAYADVRGLDHENWYFLAGSAEAVQSLSDDLGFIFFSSPKGFDHLAQTTVLDADGAVYRQVYGQQFTTPELVEPLKELVFDTPREASFVDGWMETVRLFCTIYDPTSDRYRFDYSIFVGIFVGVLCLGAVAIFLIRAWREAV